MPPTVEATAGCSHRRVRTDMPPTVEATAECVSGSVKKLCATGERERAEEGPTSRWLFRPLMGGSVGVGEGAQVADPLLAACQLEDPGWSAEGRSLVAFCSEGAPAASAEEELLACFRSIVAECSSW